MDEMGTTSPPIKSKTFAAIARKRTAIMPTTFNSVDTKTPEGFSLKKFIEDNQKKMQEKQMKIEEASDEDEEPEDEEEKIIIKKRLFCRVHDKLRIKWDLLIMLLAIWNSIQIPYSIAFNPSDDKSVFNIILNFIVDCFFMCDVVLNFRTSFIIEESGEEVFSNKRIALQYLKGRFWIDLISSIPTDLLLIIFSEVNGQAKTALTAIKLLKLIRLARLSKVITYLNFKSNVKISLRLIKLIFILILYLHLVCCLWFYIVSQQEDWVPPLYQSNGTSDFYLENPFLQYVISIYYSVLLLAGNDMSPQGYVQIIFVTILLFAASIINANIFGNIAVLLQQIYRKSSNFQDKLEMATSTMKNINIPEKLQKIIMHYLSTSQSTIDQQEEFDIFLTMLSPSLKIEVTKCIFQTALISNPIFENKPQMVEQVLHDLKTSLFIPEDEICRQGAIGREIYFLAKGECEVYITDENQTLRYVTCLKMGEYFGEVSLIKDCARTATVKSKNYSTCASLDKAKFDKLLDRYSFLRKAMENRISEKYQDKLRKFIKKSLRNVEFLARSVPEEIIEEISYKLEIK